MTYGTDIPGYISVAELPQYEKRPDIVLLDVRDKQSFVEHHLPNAVSMLPEQLVDNISTMAMDKHYIIVCYHGVMAVPVAEFMHNHGLKASVLQGGMSAFQ